MEINYREWLYSDARVCARKRERESTTSTKGATGAPCLLRNM